jgi:hypothetical protein
MIDETRYAFGLDGSRYWSSKKKIKDDLPYEKPNNHRKD